MNNPETTIYVCPTKVAILMAAYNAEKYLPEQIESVISQNNNDWTLYIRNDGSKDNTQQIISDYSARFPNKIIQIDINGENLGCNQNFYRLLSSVDADYYMFCDADDVWINDKVSHSLKQIQHYETMHPDKPILVHHDMSVCDSELNIMYNSLWEHLKINPSKYTTFGMLLVSPVVGGSTSIFNQKAIKYIFPTPTDSRIYYDHWVSLQIAKFGVVVADKYIGKFYRQHENQECGLAAQLPLKIRIQSSIESLLRNIDIFKSIGVNPLKFISYKLLAVIDRRLNIVKCR